MRSERGRWNAMVRVGNVGSLLKEVTASCGMTGFGTTGQNLDFSGRAKRRAEWQKLASILDITESSTIQFGNTKYFDCLFHGCFVQATWVAQKIHRKPPNAFLLSEEIGHVIPNAEAKVCIDGTSKTSALLRESKTTGRKASVYRRKNNSAKQVSAYNLFYRRHTRRKAIRKKIEEAAEGALPAFQKDGIRRVRFQTNEEDGDLATNYIVY